MQQAAQVGVGDGAAVRVVGGAGLGEISIWLDGTLLGTMSGPPYQIWWELTPGVHTIWAESEDMNGSMIVSAQVTFEVLAPVQLSQQE